MAITFDGVNVGFGTDASSSITVTDHEVSGFSPIILVKVAVQNANEVISVKWESVGGDELFTQFNEAINADGTRSSLHYLTNPTPGTDDIVVVVSGTDHWAMVAANTYLKVDQVNPFRVASSVTDSGNSSSASVDVVALDGEMVVDSFCRVLGVGNANEITPDHQVRHNVVNNLQPLGDDTHGASQEKLSTGDTYAMGWTIDTSESWSLAAGALQEAYQHHSFYVRTSGGSDSNDGSSVAQGFATLVKARDEVTALSFVDSVQVFMCVMADGEKFSQATFTVNISQEGWLKWSGANSSGIVDGTIAIVDSTSGDAIQLNSLAVRNYWEYISAEGGTIGWDINQSSRNLFYRCNARDNTSEGWKIYSDTHVFIECIADNNTRGFYCYIGSSRLIGCVGKNNSTSGFYGSFNAGIWLGEHSVTIRCLAHDNPSGFYRIGAVENCVGYNNTGDGVEYNGSNEGKQPLVVNGIFTDNGDLGIEPAEGSGIFLSNVLYNNSTNNMDRVGFKGFEENTIELVGIPFRDPVNDDFTLNNTVSGYGPRVSMEPKAWIKKPANLITNAKFESNNWPEVGNWTISNGVAHHSPTSSTQLDYTPTILVDDLEYEVIYTISNYVQGSVAIKIGSTQGTTRSSNGTFRQFIVGANSSGLVSFVPVSSSFEADISDVLVAPVHSGPWGNKSYGGGRMTSYGAAGVARPKDRRIKTG